MATAAEITLLIKAQNQASKEIAAIQQQLRGVAPAAQQASGGLSAVGSALGKIGLASLGISAIVRAVQTLGGVLAGPIQSASALNETISKAGVVFGQSTAKVQEFAQQAVGSLGLTQQAAIESAATFGNLFTSLGLGRSSAADMSTRMVQLAADLASFNNTAGGSNQVLQDLNSGIVGETEPLRKYGIVLLESSVAAEAVRLGLAATTTQVSETAKVQARYSLIVQQSANAQGDFARTSGDLANAQRIIGAGFGEMITKIGAEFLPGWKAVVSALGKDLPALIPVVVKALQPLADGFNDLGRRVAEFIKSGGLRDWVAGIGEQVNFALRALGILAQGFSTAFESILRIVYSVGTLILDAFGLINPWVRHSPSLIDQVDSGFAHIGDSARGLAGLVIPAFQAAGAAMASLGAAAASGLARAADIATTALNKNLSVLGPGVVAAYQAAKSALDTYTTAMIGVADQMQAAQTEIDGMNQALKEQEGVLAGLENGLKPLQKAYEAARKYTSDLKSQIDDATRAISDLANTALPGENAAGQKVFGLENAKNILELERAKLVQSGASEKDPRVKALDEQIKRHEEAIKIARLEQKVNFDGARNEIDQAAKAASYTERDKNAILKGIGEQISKRAELSQTLDNALAAEMLAKAAIDQQTAAIETQKAAIDQARDAIEAKRAKLAELQGVYDDLKKSAQEWKDKLDEVKNAASAIEQSLKAAAGAAGAGLALPKLPPLEAPKFLGTGASGPDAVNQLVGPGALGTAGSPFETQLQNIKNLAADANKGLKDIADWMSKIAGTGTTAAEAFERLSLAFGTLKDNGFFQINIAGKDDLEFFNTIKEVVVDIANILNGKPLVPKDVVAPRAQPGQPDQSREQQDYQPIVKQIKALHDAWVTVSDWWSGDGATLREGMATWLGPGLGTLLATAIKPIAGPANSFLSALGSLYGWWNGDGKTLRDGIATWLGQDVGVQASTGGLAFSGPAGSLLAGMKGVYDWWYGDGNTWRKGIDDFFNSDLVNWINVGVGVLLLNPDSLKMAWQGLSTWWNGDGATWRTAISTFLTSDLVGWIGTALGWISNPTGSSLRAAWGLVQGAAQTLLDFFGLDFKKGIEELIGPKGALGLLLTFIGNILSKIQDLFSWLGKVIGRQSQVDPNVGGNTTPGSLSVSPLSLAQAGSGRTTSASVVINNTIDARGMSAGQVTQAAGADLATLTRRRLISGAL